MKAFYFNLLILYLFKKILNFNIELLYIHYQFIVPSLLAIYNFPLNLFVIQAK